MPTLIKSLAVHLTSAASFGHLLSLRNISNGGSVILLVHIIAVVLFPLLPVAQALRQLCFAMALSFQKRPLDVRFSIAVFCGMHATNSAQEGLNEPLRRLVEMDRSRLCRTRAPYGYLWLGRVVVLLALLAQYCGTILIWWRRTSRAPYVRVWAIDIRNLEVALGGCFTIFSSLVISFLNTRWKVVDESEHDSEPLSVISQGPPLVSSRHQGVAPVLDFAAFGHEHQTGDNRTIRPMRQLTNSYLGDRLFLQLLLLFERAKGFYVKFRSLNVKVSRASTRVYPLDLQWDTELAYFLKVFMSLFIMPFDSSYPFNFRDFPSPYILYWRFVDCFYHAGYTPWNRPRMMVLMIIFYLLPFITLLVHMLFWLVANTWLPRILPTIVGKVASEVDFWFRTGRTLFSIPLSLLMLTPFYFQLLFMVFDFEVIGRCEAYWDTGYQDTGCLWSDPLAEKLFVF